MGFLKSSLIILIVVTLMVGCGEGGGGVYLAPSGSSSESSNPPLPGRPRSPTKQGVKIKERLYDPSQRGRLLFTPDGGHLYNITCFRNIRDVKPVNTSFLSPLVESSYICQEDGKNCSPTLSSKLLKRVWEAAQKAVKALQVVSSPPPLPGVEIPKSDFGAYFVFRPVAKGGLGRRNSRKFVPKPMTMKFKSIDTSRAEIASLPNVVKDVMSGFIPYHLYYGKRGGELFQKPTKDKPFDKKASLSLAQQAKADSEMQVASSDDFTRCKIERTIVGSGTFEELSINLSTGALYWGKSRDKPLPILFFGDKEGKPFVADWDLLDVGVTKEVRDKFCSDVRLKWRFDPPNPPVKGFGGGPSWLYEFFVKEQDSSFPVKHGPESYYRGSEITTERCFFFKVNAQDTELNPNHLRAIPFLTFLEEVSKKTQTFFSNMFQGWSGSGKDDVSIRPFCDGIDVAQSS